MNQNLIKKWLIAKIKPNSYDLASRNLERQGFETFLPKMRVTVRKKNKFIHKYLFVFPGYIFVGVDPQNSNWTKIKNTYGVSKVLLFNNKPYEISFEIILALKNRYELNTFPIKNETLKKGDKIMFSSGPFVDLIARIEAVDDKDRISLILEVAGEYRKLKIQQIEKLNFTRI